MRPCRVGTTERPGCPDSVSVPAAGRAFAYRSDMCLGPDGELEGQISINELLVAMGEPPVEPLLLTEAPDDASSLFDGPRALPGL